MVSTTQIETMEWQELRRHATGVSLIGVALVVLGVFAFGAALLTTLLTVMLLGGILLVAGVVQLVQGLWVGGWRGMLSNAFIGILSIIVGLLLLSRPGIGVAALSLLVIALLWGSGLNRLVTASALRYPGWGWSFASGLLAVVLGTFLLLGWPATGLWVVGTLVGIELFFWGIALISLATAARRQVPLRSPPEFEAERGGFVPPQAQKRPPGEERRPPTH